MGGGVKDGLVEYEDIWPRVKVNWKINDVATLENDTYYLKAKRHWRNVESYTHDKVKNEVNRSFYLEILHDQKQVGNRSNLLLDFNIAGLNNRLSIGAEINQIDFTHTNNSPYHGSAPPVSFDDPTPGTWAESVDSPTSKDFSSDTLQYAFFIDDVLQINEQVSLVVGLRHDKIDYEREDFSRPNNNEPAKDTDDSFIHARWVHLLNTKWAVEGFLQWEDDVFDNLKSRGLIGSNIRHAIAQDDKVFSLSVGLGGFFEREVLDLDTYEQESKLWRINSFAVYKHTINDNIGISATFYYQPNTADFTDYRTYLTSALLVKLTNTLDLKLQYQMTRDSQPAKNLAATPVIDNHEVNTNYQTSLVYRF